MTQFHRESPGGRGCGNYSECTKPLREAQIVHIDYPIQTHVVKKGILSPEFIDEDYQSSSHYDATWEMGNGILIVRDKTGETCYPLISIRRFYTTKEMVHDE